MDNNSREELTTKLPERKESIYKSVCDFSLPSKDTRAKDYKRLIIVSIVCVLFMIAEVVGGVMSNSLAIATDAAHLLTDFGAFMVSLSAIYISSKPKTKRMSFGFHRAEVLGALISVLSIWLITGILVYMATLRLINTNYEINATVMLYVSIAGIFANLIMGLILVFSKGISKVSKKMSHDDESLNIKSALIHVIGDFLQSVGVLVASLIIYFEPEYKIMDPICTFLFSIIVLASTFRIIKDIFYVLMEALPKHLNFDHVVNVLFSVPGVIKVHHLRLWSLTTDKVALSAHVVIRKGEQHAEVLKNVIKTLSRDLNIYEVTIQVEELEEPENSAAI